MSRWATIHLPPLGEREASILADVLETVLAALWDAHGDAIADWQARHGDLVPPEACSDDDSDEPT